MAEARVFFPVGPLCLTHISMVNVLVSAATEVRSLMQKLYSSYICLLWSGVLNLSLFNLADVTHSTEADCR